MKLYALLMVFCWHTALATEDVISIIANPSVAISHLSNEEIKDIFLLQNRQWVNGSPIVVVNHLAGSSIRNRFEQKYLGTEAKKYALYIEKMHYQGVSLPIIQDSTQATIAFVENVEGAIAYIEGTANNNRVKVLQELK